MEPRARCAGETFLVEPGQTRVASLVVVSGALEVIPVGEARVVVHRARSFTGEGSTLAGRPALMRGRVVESGHAIELTREVLLAVVQKDVDIVMRAYSYRRLELINSHLGDVLLLGSTHWAAALRIKEFLKRNGHPYDYTDLDHEKDIEHLLDALHVSSQQVRWRDKRSGAEETHDIRHVFMMTGAVPNTGWLSGCLALDDKGFIKTGAALTPEDLERWKWPLPRVPQLFETSLPGVFAVGDVRSGSMKRVASAVGEGSTAISLVHQALAG
jgi:hypothetical protein